MAEIIVFMHRAMTKAVKLSGEVLWRKTTGRSQGRKGMQGKEQLVLGSCVHRVRRAGGLFCNIWQQAAFTGLGQAPWSAVSGILDATAAGVVIWSPKRVFLWGAWPLAQRVVCIWFFRPWSSVVHYLAWGVPKPFSRSAEISEEGENAESELKTECCFWYLG